MAFQNTVWSSGDVPKEFQTWLIGFFDTLETPTPEAAKRLSEYFTEDGDISLGQVKIIGRKGTYLSKTSPSTPRSSLSWFNAGTLMVLNFFFRADIYEKRLKAWDVTKVRKFDISRIYTSDCGCNDILILGHLHTVLEDKRKGFEEWSARIRSHIDEKGQRQISLYRVWTVCIRAQVCEISIDKSDRN